MNNKKRAHNFIDKTNMRFGKLVCKEYLGNGKWKCLCDCGNEHIVKSDNLSMNKKKRGIQSCGCGLKSKTCPNQDYFKQIDTEEKAYILGFIASDGTIDKYSCNIRVKYTDVNILEQIKNSMGLTSKITYYEQLVNLPQGGQAISKMYSLRFYGKEIINDLASYGIVPNKTLHLKVNYNKIPEEFLKDYLRGLWDGDGCFGIYDKSNNSRIYEIGYIGSFELVNDIKIIIHKFFPIHKIDIWKAKNCNDNIYRLGLSRRDDFLEFLNFLYKNSNIHLKRKYKKYLNCIDRIQNQIKYKKSPCRNLKNSIDYPNGGEIPQ